MAGESILWVTVMMPKKIVKGGLCRIHSACRRGFMVIDWSEQWRECWGFLSLYSNNGGPAYVFKEREYPGKRRQWAECVLGRMHVRTTNKSHVVEREP